MSETVCIYALSDPRSGETRYVDAEPLTKCKEHLVTLGFDVCAVYILLDAGLVKPKALNMISANQTTAIRTDVRAHKPYPADPPHVKYEAM